MEPIRPKNPFFQGCIIGILGTVLAILVGVGLVLYGPMAYHWWRDDASDGQFFVIPVLAVLAFAGMVAVIRNKE